MPERAEQVTISSSVPVAHQDTLLWHTTHRAGCQCWPSSQPGSGSADTEVPRQQLPPNHRPAGLWRRGSARAESAGTQLNFGEKQIPVSIGTGGGKFLGLRLGLCQPGEAAGPRGSRLPSLLPGQGRRPAASPAACAPRGAPRDGGCAGTPRPPLRSRVRCDLTFSSQLSEEMRR